jgi:hypothetical protein
VSSRAVKFFLFVKKGRGFKYAPSCSPQEVRQIYPTCREWLVIRSSALSTARLLATLFPQFRSVDRRGRKVAEVIEHGQRAASVV